MKEDVSLALSIIAIVLSMCSVSKIDPFHLTSDSILSASLAVIGICTAIIVAYQIFNNATIEKRLRKLIGEEYERKSEEYKADHKRFMENDMFFFKLSLVLAMASSSNSSASSAVYPIAVNALMDCNENTQSQIETLCSILKTVHEKIDIKKNSAYSVYLNMEINALRRLTKFSDQAFDLLKQISQS